VDGEQHPEWLGVVWSVARCLWDRVTPSLRYVAVGPVNRSIVARFAYERPPTEDELDFVRHGETEVLADFHHIFDTDFLAVARPPANARVFEPDTHWWAYMRYEPEGRLNASIGHLTRARTALGNKTARSGT
jgi:hypothetical protein